MTRLARATVFACSLLLGGLAGLPPFMAQPIPSDGYPQLERARQAREAGQLQPAIRILQALGKASLPATLRARVGYELGLAYVDQRAYAQAEAQFARLPALARSADSSTLVQVLFLRGKATLSYAQGRYLQARTQVREALDSLQTHPLPPTLQAATLLQLGRIDDTLGKPEAGRSHYLEALALLQQLPAPPLTQLATLYSNVGVTYEASGDYATSLDYYQKTLALRRSALGPRHPQVADTYHNMGNVYYYLGQFEQAHDHYRQAYQIWQAAYGAVHEKIAYAYLSFGILAAVQGRNQEALDYFEQERQMKVRVYGPAHPDLAWSYNNLGLLYVRLGEHDKAFKAHKQALDMLRHTFGPRHPYLAQAHFNLADIHRIRGNTRRRLSQLQKALISVHASFSDTSLQANPSPTQVLDDREALRMLHQKALALQALAAEAGDHWLEAAFETYLAADELVDHMRSGYRSETSRLQLQAVAYRLYESAMALVHQLYQRTREARYADAALAFSDKTKAMALLAQRREDRALHFAQLPDSLLEQERALAAQLSLLDRNISSVRDTTQRLQLQATRFDLQRAHDRLVTHVETHYPSYHQLKYPGPPPSLQTAQRLLTSRQSLFSFFAGDSSLYALLVRSDQVHIQRLKEADSLASRIKAFRQACVAYFQAATPTDSLYRATAAAYAQAAHALWQQLIAPFSEALTEEVILVPDGVLAYLPFEALLQALPTSPETFRDHAYLLGKHVFTYHFSIQLWADAHMAPRPPRHHNTWLAVAPSFSGHPDSQMALPSAGRSAALPPLVHNEAEARLVHELHGGTLLTGSQAKLERFLQEAPQHAYLHLATHARLNLPEEQASFLAFHGPGDSLGNLYLRDLYGLSLDAELVVLSACETSLGPLKRGEGIYSLARGFAYAGVHSLVSTLWQVNDAQAVKLMRLFYQNLARKLPKHRALRQAKLTYLKAGDHVHAHPFFWASSVQIGNTRPTGRGGLPAWAWIGLTGLVTLGGGMLARYVLRRRPLAAPH